jgi:hypothetical protein
VGDDNAIHGFKTAELETEVVDSTEVVTEVVLLPEANTSSRPSDNGVVVFRVTGLSLGFSCRRQLREQLKSRSAPGAVWKSNWGRGRAEGQGRARTRGYDRI